MENRQPVVESLADEAVRELCGTRIISPILRRSFTIVRNSVDKPFMDRNARVAADFAPAAAGLATIKRSSLAAPATRECYESRLGGSLTDR